MINLGCGTRFHSDWINIDFSPLARRIHYPMMMTVFGKCGIISQGAYEDFKKALGHIHYHDLRRLPLPLPDGCADTVYHSNILEHFSKRDGKNFLGECYRLLKKNGILRVVVPDLQILIRAYLAAIEPSYDAARYEKAVYDLFDQIVRTESGEKNRDLKFSPAAKLKRLLGLRPNPEKLGELHKWMYDQYSLSTLLTGFGFRDIRVLNYRSSGIPNFERYHLDNNPDGTEYKESMLYIEARR